MINVNATGGEVTTSWATTEENQPTHKSTNEPPNMIGELRRQLTAMAEETDLEATTRNQDQKLEVTRTNVTRNGSKKEETIGAAMIITAEAASGDHHFSKLI